MRKNRLCCVILISLMLVSLLTPIFSSAADPSAKLEGPSTVRAGDYIVLTLKVTGSDIYGFEGSVDAGSGLTLSSTKCTFSSSWKMEMNGSKFIIYDDNLTSPLSGTSKAVATFTFRVSSSCKTGSNISVKLKGITAVDKKYASSSIADVSYSKTITKPKSSEAHLASLSCSNAELAPAFDASTYEYSASVDFAVSSLELSYKCKDSGAKATISGNDLKVGENIVTITVEAEDGTKKEYKIKVTRGQDPDYVPSSDAALSSIELSQGTLSPEFDCEKDKYIVYLPYETKELTISGTARDPLAREVVGGTFELSEGPNACTVSGIAEDGSEKSYSIVAFVMPEYMGADPEVIAHGNDICGTLGITGEPNPGNTLTAEVLLAEGDVARL